MCWSWNASPPDVAEKRAANLGTVLPGVPGGIALSHPGACQALSEAAVAAGARVAQGITGVRVTAGDPPRLRYRDGDADREVEARLVVGADGRSSVVRRQVGIPLYGDGPRTFGAGLLVESLDGWPAGMYSVGTWRDVLHYVFPRRDGRTRLYLCWGKHDAARFAGPRGAGAFLDCFASLACLPDPDAFRRVEPIGPCASYPFGDTRTVRPYVEGAVLIGDAAGYNDPIIGQGLSLAIRDVRAVSEVLLGSPRWTATMFEDYAAERAERMRRLSATATAFTRLRCTFTDEGRRRRGAAFARFAADPASLAPLLAAAIGPEELPPEAFEPAAADRMLAL